MKLTFKDLKQQRFTIEAEPSETIGSLKEKISAEKGWETSIQKLIYSGKILQDDRTIESYSIEEKGFIVCMTSKPKPAPSKAAEPSTPAKSAATPAAPSAPAPVAQGLSTSQVPATPSPLPAQSTTTNAQAPGFNDPSALAIGDERAAAIENMEAMGFERSEIDRAMRAAFFNPDRAVEYLVSGIPDNIQQSSRPAAGQTSTTTSANAPAAVNASEQGTAADEQDLEDDAQEGEVNLFEQAAAQAGGRRTGANRGGGAFAGLQAGGDGPDEAALNQLQQSTAFQQLRQAVQVQPQMLEPILQQLSQTDPHLARLITQNPARFLEMLSQDVGEEGGVMPPAQQLVVTEEEREAIERLCRLGFDRDSAIQAYFACDKNEEWAANFLFDQPEDEDDGH